MIVDAKQKDSNKMKNFLMGKNCSTPSIKFRSAFKFLSAAPFKIDAKTCRSLPKVGDDTMCLQIFSKVFLNIFPKFTAKHLCWSLFNKVAGPHTCNFIKKRLQYSCFPVNIATFLSTPFSQNTSGWPSLRALPKSRKKLKKLC